MSSERRSVILGPGSRNPGAWSVIRCILLERSHFACLLKLFYQLRSAPTARKQRDRRKAKRCCLRDYLQLPVNPGLPPPLLFRGDSAPLSFTVSDRLVFFPYTFNDPDSLIPKFPAPSIFSSRLAPFAWA